MKRKTYRLSLRGIDTTDYEGNPIVLLCHDPRRPIGKATILKGKRKVEVEYFDRVPYGKHSLGPATISYDYGRSVLVDLSVIPVVDGLI